MRDVIRAAALRRRRRARRARWAGRVIARLAHQLEVAVLIELGLTADEWRQGLGDLNELGRLLRASRSLQEQVGLVRSQGGLLRPLRLAARRQARRALREADERLAAVHASLLRLGAHALTDGVADEEPGNVAERVREHVEIAWEALASLSAEPAAASYRAALRRTGRTAATERWGSVTVDPIHDAIPWRRLQAGRKWAEEAMSLARQAGAVAVEALIAPVPPADLEPRPWDTGRRP